MSINVVDTALEYNKQYGPIFGFIPSRRQVDYNGGYVNNWNTEAFYQYVKSKISDIIISEEIEAPVNE